MWSIGRQELLKDFGTILEGGNREESGSGGVVIIGLFVSINDRWL
jgi:hypothetical protein